MTTNPTNDFGSWTQFKSADNIDNVVLKYIIDTFDIKTMVDIGCGRGKQVESAREMGIDAIGIDGSPSLTIYNKPHFIMHDYTQGKLEGIGKFDLGWSVEFLEHVFSKYIPNFLDTFSHCKFVLCTHALPGQRGTHHVNCQTNEYWLDIFTQYGFTQNTDVTTKIREIAENQYTRRTGLFLERNFVE